MGNRFCVMSHSHLMVLEMRRRKMTNAKQLLVAAYFCLCVGLLYGEAKFTCTQYTFNAHPLSLSDTTSYIDSNTTKKTTEVVAKPCARRNSTVWRRPNCVTRMVLCLKLGRRAGCGYADAGDSAVFFTVAFRFKPVSGRPRYVSMPFV